ncbi:hypothetical protein CDCA_CDCA01G0311 [Cyanidium caldarium]|uniref:Mon2 C-terminal domain-containing protein n=1 Tax=Cyanidium caldarium TaxID=2771 RepID=A0AAV9IQD0_CYACA|nr:hypothetical protein CDCA_CDCA01G0311 [Cyanidium caldarium]
MASATPLAKLVENDLRALSSAARKVRQETRVAPDLPTATPFLRHVYTDLRAAAEQAIVQLREADGNTSTADSMLPDVLGSALLAATPSLEAFQRHREVAASALSCLHRLTAHHGVASSRLPDVVAALRVWVRAVTDMGEATGGSFRASAKQRDGHGATGARSSGIWSRAWTAVATPDAPTAGKSLRDGVAGGGGAHAEKLLLRVLQILFEMPLAVTAPAEATADADTNTTAAPAVQGVFALLLCLRDIRWASPSVHATAEAALQRVAKSILDNAALRSHYGRALFEDLVAQARGQPPQHGFGGGNVEAEMPTTGAEDAAAAIAGGGVVAEAEGRAPPTSSSLKDTAWAPLPVSLCLELVTDALGAYRRAGQLSALPSIPLLYPLMQECLMEPSPPLAVYALCAELLLLFMALPQYTPAVESLLDTMSKVVRLDRNSDDEAGDIVLSRGKRAGIIEAFRAVTLAPAPGDDGTENTSPLVALLQRVEMPAGGPAGGVLTRWMHALHAGIAEAAVPGDGVVHLPPGPLTGVKPDYVSATRHRGDGAAATTDDAASTTYLASAALGCSFGIVRAAAEQAPAFMERTWHTALASVSVALSHAPRLEPHVLRAVLALGVQPLLRATAWIVFRALLIRTPTSNDAETPLDESLATAYDAVFAVLCKALRTVAASGDASRSERLELLLETVVTHVRRGSAGEMALWVDVGDAVDGQASRLAVAHDPFGAACWRALLEALQPLEDAWRPRVDAILLSAARAHPSPATMATLGDGGAHAMRALTTLSRRELDEGICPGFGLRFVEFLMAQTLVCRGLTTATDGSSDGTATMWETFSIHLQAVATLEPTAAVHALSQVIERGLEVAPPQQTSEEHGTGTAPRGALTVDQHTLFAPLIAMVSAAAESLHRGDAAAAETLLDASKQRLTLLTDVLQALHRLVHDYGDRLDDAGWSATLQVLREIGGCTVSISAAAVSASPLAHSLATLHESGFEVLQLIASTFLDCLPQAPGTRARRLWIDTLGTYAQVPADVNTALAAIGLLWSTSDALRKDTRPGADQDDDSVAELWVRLAETLRAAGTDRRPEVRHSAVQSLFGVLLTHGASLAAPPVWSWVWERALLPLAEAVLGDAAMVVSPSTDDDETVALHHSRDTPAKQWEETRVLLLDGMARLLRAYYASVLWTLPGFTDVWTSFLECLVPRADATVALDNSPNGKRGLSAAVAATFRAALEVAADTKRQQLAEMRATGVDVADAPSSPSLALADALWLQGWRTLASLPPERAPMLLRSTEALTVLAQTVSQLHTTANECMEAYTRQLSLSLSVQWLDALLASADVSASSSTQRRAQEACLEQLLQAMSSVQLPSGDVGAWETHVQALLQFLRQHGPPCVTLAAHHKPSHEVPLAISALERVLQRVGQLFDDAALARFSRAKWLSEALAAVGQCLSLGDLRNDAAAVTLPDTATAALISAVDGALAEVGDARALPADARARLHDLCEQLLFFEGGGGEARAAVATADDASASSIPLRGSAPSFMIHIGQADEERRYVAVAQMLYRARMPSLLIRGVHLGERRPAMSAEGEAGDLTGRAESWTTALVNPAYRVNFRRACIQGLFALCRGVSSDVDADLHRAHAEARRLWERVQATYWEERRRAGRCPLPYLRQAEAEYILRQARLAGLAENSA